MVLVNNFYFRFIFLVKFFELFDECFLNDFKNYFYWFFLIRYNFTLKTLFLFNNKYLSLHKHSFFIDNQKFYFFCYIYNYLYFLYLFYPNQKKQILHFFNYFILNIKFYIVMHFRVSLFNFSFLFKSIIPKFYFFHSFILKIDYLTFLLLRSYLAVYKAFQYNKYLKIFFIFTNNSFLINFFKIKYTRLGRFQKYYPLLIRRVFRVTLGYHRYLIYRYFHFYAQKPIFNNLYWISSNFILFNGFLMFFILTLLLPDVRFYVNKNFMSYLVVNLIYYTYNSFVHGDLGHHAFYYSIISDYAFIEEIIDDAFVIIPSYRIFFYQFFFNFWKFNLFNDILNKSFILNNLIINNFLNTDIDSYSDNDFYLKKNLNRFFYKINYLFVIEYFTIAFYDHFWDLDILPFEEVFTFLNFWFMWDCYGFIRIEHFCNIFNILSFFSNFKFFIDFIIWNIFNIKFIFKFYYFYFDFYYYIKKLDLDNFISYDYCFIGTLIDKFFNKIRNNFIDFIYIVQSCFVFVFIRDFFFKFLEYFKLFLFFYNNLIYLNIFWFLRIFQENLFLYNIKKLILYDIFLCFRINSSFFVKLYI